MEFHNNGKLVKWSDYTFIGVLFISAKCRATNSNYHNLYLECACGFGHGQVLGHNFHDRQK